MRKTAWTALATALLMAGAPSPARADILFYFNDPGALQPGENLLFNDDSLILSGLTVQGLTNQTSTLFDITGEENLFGGGGQARVFTGDSGFRSLLIEPHSAGTFFGQFEANLKVYSPAGRPPSGLVTVAVTNNVGNVETSDYTVSGGQNYFSLLAIDPQAIRSVLITSNLDLSEIEQIRIGEVQQPGASDGDVSVPEPAMLLLFGAALIAGARRVRRR